ncbi:NfeD family protein [Thermoanaerobacterium sp. DL9XJH110]|uniref:NfeD family protein n=1 Tax=Thermoanaerobacterium sp. DL9XJH110 TaxID=3386643 RepID=UPI003BB52583
MKPKSIFFLAVLFFLIAGVYVPAVENQSDAVYVIPVKGVIDRGLAKFVERGIVEARRAEARAVIFEIDTPGGEIYSARQISDAILNSQLRTVSFINDEATSAGVLVAISAKTVVVAPGATIGAAEPRPKEEKYVSYWTSILRNVAERNGRNGEIVAAMADSDTVIEGLKEKGKILSLTARQALEWGLADKMARDRAELLALEELRGARVIEPKPTLAETIAQLATNPFVSPVLLTVGIVGAVTEVLTPGFGFPGVIGLIAFSLFFGGNLLAGAAQYWVPGLFVLGILLLAIETFVPGFGVFGLAGIICIAGSIIIAFPDPGQALVSLIIAVIASGFIMYFVARYLVKTPAFDRLILGTKQDKSQGYVASHEDLSIYQGKKGTALTPLRPAGAVDFDGRRLDVVTEGEFIPAGSPVVAVKVEGSKITVRLLGKENK